MATTISQKVRVEAGGRIAVQSDQLREGETADVQITVSRPDDLTPQMRLDLLHRIQEHMSLTPEAADGWIAEIRAARDARPY